MSDIFVHPYETTVEEKYMDAHGYGRTRNVKRVHRGITLRDQFALAALTGYMAVPDNRTYNPNMPECKGLTLEEWQDKILGFDTEHVYRVADAMMKARKQETI